MEKAFKEEFGLMEKQEESQWEQCPGDKGTKTAEEGQHGIPPRGWQPWSILHVPTLFQ